MLIEECTGRYKVIAEFDPLKEYGRSITRQVSQRLGTLGKDSEFESKDITIQHLSDDTLMRNPTNVASRNKNINAKIVINIILISYS